VARDIRQEVGFVDVFGLAAGSWWVALVSLKGRHDLLNMPKTCASAERDTVTLIRGQSERSCMQGVGQQGLSIGPARMSR
jgi:hypothetical protein